LPRREDFLLRMTSIRLKKTGRFGWKTVAGRID
jgi:hypothetical protein